MRITIGKFDEAGEPVWFDVETDELEGGTKGVKKISSV